LDTHTPIKAKRKPGRPKTPDALSPHYTRRSISLPAQAFKNLDKLAKRLNARAKSGPNYGKASWRNWLRTFALEDVPEILAFLDSRQIEFEQWKSLKLTVKVEYVEPDNRTTEEGAHTNGHVTGVCLPPV
jgi:hypothetical protein